MWSKTILGSTWLAALPPAGWGNKKAVMGSYNLTAVFGMADALN